VGAVDVPVTLKIRTGWDREHKNAIQVARIAEASGIQSLVIHGRTRACGYSGDAEYETIAAVKDAISIPVVANGDITTPEKALAVFRQTGADAIMVGRAAMGRPWIFREIDHFLKTGEHLPAPTVSEIRVVMAEHLDDLYGFYGELTGLRMARKHIGWYTKGLPDSSAFRHAMNQLQTVEEQRGFVLEYFARLEDRSAHLEYDQEAVAA
jgi:tRNA-dihydrouridine synthase B